MKTEQLIHAIGTAVGTSVVYEIRCLLAARKERRQRAGNPDSSYLRYRLAYRLGKLWARCKKLRGRTLA
jgi:hypothetical protein